MAVKLIGPAGRKVRMPKLVSRKVAAEILGIASPNLGRLVESGKMPDPIDVEGGAPVYVRSEVEALARELRKAKVKG